MPLICHSANSFLLLPSPVVVGGVVQYIKKSVKNSDLRHKATAKKIKYDNRLLHIFIFIFFYYFFASFKEKTIFQNLFSHPHFLILIFLSHFPIRVLSSTFYHPHFVICILLSAIRHPPSAAIRSAPYRDPFPSVTTRQVFRPFSRCLKYSRY